MRLDNFLSKRNLILGLLIIIVIVWMGLLTQKSGQHNQALISLNQNISNNEDKINYQRVNEKLSDLSERFDLEQNKNNEVVTHAQLSDIQDELRSRIQQVSRQFDDTISHEQLQQLQQEITMQITKLNDQLVQQSAEITQIKKNTTQVNAIAKPTTVSKSTTQNTPFIIQGKELRAGEWVLSVLPVKQKNIESTVLLTIGQSFGSWQLVTIEDHHAVFKVAKQKRRLAIPN